MKHKDNYRLCYLISEKDRNSIIKKIKKTYDSRVTTYELRCDHLDCLKGKGDILLAIDTINYVTSKFPRKKFIITIRTKTEGGNISLSKKRYATYISELYYGVKADYIDIEDRYYDAVKELLADKKNKEKIRNKKHIKIIVSKHVFDKKFSIVKCENIIKRLMKKKANILKLAVRTEKLVDVCDYMKFARKYSTMIKAHRKDCIFIAMGKAGLISRIFPEYTNTKIVFLDTYNRNNSLKNNKLFQPNLRMFLRLHRVYAINKFLNRSKCLTR